MKWVRGKKIGHGGSVYVSSARITQTDDNNIPSIVALKSCRSFFSASLRKEKEILDSIGICPQIIRCFGAKTTFENGTMLYNLLLEFAIGGTLADQAKRHGGRLPEPLLRRHARTILQGLSTIHSRGFVHCDIKPENVLVFGDGEIKIADFDVAIKTDHGEKKKNNNNKKKKKKKKLKIIGTPLYVAPEPVKDEEYGPPCDVWALGCLVAELASGRPVWDYPEDSKQAMLLRVAGDGEEAEIPAELSEEGRDFVRKCLDKDSKRRWTVSMLLDHAFVNSSNDNSNDSELLLSSPESEKNDMPCFTALLNGFTAFVRNLVTEETSVVDCWDSCYAGLFNYNL